MKGDMDMDAPRNFWRHRITLGERIVWTVGIVATLGLAIYSVIVEGHL